MLPKAPTAASGVRKLGICASASAWRAAPTDESPIQQATSGLASRGLICTSSRATASASPPNLGE